MATYICSIVKIGGYKMIGISWIGFFTFLQSAIFVVGYISNNSLFPEPLTPEEESFFLNKMEKR